MKDDKLLYGSSSSTSLPCSGNHTIFWTGAPFYEIPEGTPCACGQTKVNYTVCKKCGHRRMDFVPV